MKSSYTLLLACLAISSLVYAKSEEHLVRSENADHKKSKSHKENSSKAKHYLYPRSSRPKKHASGVTLSGLSVKGNVLVPISKDTLKEAHNCMMHVYEHTFHAKHGHVLEVMQTIVESKSKKEFAAFKKAIARIHESSDDWNALKQASASYDLVALTYVEFCEKERLQEKKCELNSRLEKVLRKIAHTQPALVYASGKLAHSRLLLQEYAQDCIFIVSHNNCNN